MKKNVVTIVITGIMCLGLAMTSAAYGMSQSSDANTNASANTTAPVKVNNTVCPVTGNPVDMNNPVTVEYNGKIYNLCCPMCPATFKSNPEKYSKIAEDQAKTAGN